MIRSVTVRSSSRRPPAPAPPSWVVEAGTGPAFPAGGGASWLSAGRHSSTLIGVAGRGYTGQSVEIAAAAVVPEVPETRR